MSETKQKMETLMDAYNRLQKQFEDGKISISVVLRAERKAAIAKSKFIRSMIAGR